MELSVNLSKNGWHRKLQTFAFGKDAPLFNDFCRYFWLTIASFIITFIFPIIPVIKLLEIFIYRPIIKFQNWFDQKKYIDFEKGLDFISGDNFTDENEKFAAAVLLNEATKLQLVWKNFTTIEEWDKYYESWRAKYQKLGGFIKNATKDTEKFKLLKLFLKWKTDNGENADKIFQEKLPLLEKIWQRMETERLDAEKRVDEFIQKEELRKAKIEALKAKYIPSAKKFFSAIAKYTKYPFFVMLTALVVFLIYWIGLFIHWLAYKVPHAKFVHFLIGISICFIIVVTVFGVIWCLKQIFSFIHKRLFPNVGFKISTNGRATFHVIGLGIKSFFMFFVLFVKAFKANYCPAINWKEDKKQD